MSEQALSISHLNDFIFCPVSIYFHLFDSEEEKLLYQEEAQLNGSHAHRHSDGGTYSTKKAVLQGACVYSERYDLFGKIDTFDCETGRLTERKKHIQTVYDGYVFQLYAQYFALTEMGYTVREIRLYSMDDNTVYPMPLPEEDPRMFQRFEQLLTAMRSFSMDRFRQDNPLKCARCIYEPLCSFSAL